MRIFKPESENQLLEARNLINEYASSLNFDLCFQDFEKELREFPGEYSPPAGCVILASENEAAIGCVAMRKLSKDICEMKRLYVRPKFRRRGTGKLLAKSVIMEARKTGYAEMRLDTLASMREAIALYQHLGFKRIEAYRHNPIEDAVYMELSL